MSFNGFTYSNEIHRYSIYNYIRKQKQQFFSGYWLNYFLIIACLCLFAQNVSSIRVIFAQFLLTPTCANDLFIYIYHYNIHIIISLFYRVVF